MSQTAIEAVRSFGDTRRCLPLPVHGGDLYQRQGAKFPVDVIVIDGRGASKRPKPYIFKGGGLPAVFNT